jgi:hypothetical protein
MLVHAVENKNAHQRRHQRLPTTLVVRESCGATLQGERPPPA